MLEHLYNIFCTIKRLKTSLKLCTSWFNTEKRTYKSVSMIFYKNVDFVVFINKDSLYFLIYYMIMNIKLSIRKIKIWYNRFLSVHLISSLIKCLKKTILLHKKSLIKITAIDEKAAICPLYMTKTAVFKGKFHNILNKFIIHIKFIYLRLLLFVFSHPIFSHIIIVIMIFIIRIYFCKITVHPVTHPFEFQSESSLYFVKNTAKIENYGLGHALENDLYIRKCHNYQRSIPQPLSTPPQEHPRIFYRNIGLGPLLQLRSDYCANNKWSVPFHYSLELHQIFSVKQMFYTFSSTITSTNRDMIINDALTFMQTRMPSHIWSLSPAMRADHSTPIHGLLDHLLHHIKPDTPDEIMHAIYLNAAIIAYDLVDHNDLNIQAQFKKIFDITFNEIHKTYKHHYENL